MSMRSLFLDVDLSFDSAREAAESEEILLWLIGVVARKNLFYLRRNPGTPKIYSRQAGIRWCPPDQMRGTWIPRDRIPALAEHLRREGMTEERIKILIRLVSGVEIFQDVQTLLASRKGDCDRLVGARLGELWHAGIVASPYLIAYPNDRGGTTYHAVVLHADGSSECPSVICGMKGYGREWAEEVRKNRERHDDLLKAAAELMLFDGEDESMLGAIVDAAGYVPPGGFQRPNAMLRAA